MSDRFFLDAPFFQDDHQFLEGPEFHHLTHVMRISVGDTVELVNGKNQLATARVESMTKKVAELLLLSVTEEPQKPPLILGAALFRFSRLEWLIEKAVELNATEIRLFPATRSEKKSVTKTQLERFEQIVLSAMKQCKRLDLPQISFYPSLQELPLEGSALFGDLREGAEPMPKTASPLMLLIGPEGGFTPQEILFLESKGAKGISLHKNVLRAETAGVVALVQVQS